MSIATAVQSPPVGWPVHYFPRGDSTSPHAAVVTERYINGQCRMNYQRVGGGDNIPTRFSCPHAGDDTVNKEVILRAGTWDFIPGFPVPPEMDEPGGKTRFNPPPTNYSAAQGPDSRLVGGRQPAPDKRLAENKTVADYSDKPAESGEPEIENLPEKDYVFDTMVKLVESGEYDDNSIAKKAYGHGWKKENVEAFLAYMRN